jgi:acyl-CoA thioester hydrolase
MIAPVVQHEESVRPEWIDYNGHMNLAYYVVVFDHATDALFDMLGVGSSYREGRNCSNFVLETHTLYERELAEGDRLRVISHLMAADTKRLHFFHEMFHADQGFRAAAQELLSVHVDLASRRSAAFPPDRTVAIEAMLRARTGMTPPRGIGRRIAMPTRTSNPA